MRLFHGFRRCVHINVFVCVCFRREKDRCVYTDDLYSGRVLYIICNKVSVTIIRVTHIVSVLHVYFARVFMLHVQNTGAMTGVCYAHM